MCSYRHTLCEWVNVSVLLLNRLFFETFEYIYIFKSFNLAQYSLFTTNQRNELNNYTGTTQSIASFKIHFSWDSCCFFFIDLWSLHVCLHVFICVFMWCYTKEETFFSLSTWYSGQWWKVHFTHEIGLNDNNLKHRYMNFLGGDNNYRHKITVYKQS